MDLARRALVLATLGSALAAAMTSCSNASDSPATPAPSSAGGAAGQGGSGGGSGGGAAGAACLPPDGIVDLETAKERAPTLDRLCLVAPAGGGMVTPEAGSVPYDLVSPLFSDYLLKTRTVRVPPGTQATYNADGVFTFPVGTMISKTFAYAEDLRSPLERRHLIETRVLLRLENDWLSLPYLWDEQGTVATLSVGGTIKPLSFLRDNGMPIAMNYLVPNKNQCIKCHEDLSLTAPIGPKARNLNRDFAYPEGAENQLAHWARLGILAGAPDPASAPRLAAWDDPGETTERRARSWLEINCAHCHNDHGAARTSGLTLWASEDNQEILGFCKPPVAAGGGAGTFTFDIVPGMADQSILVYRMESTDPAVMMPELGRAVVHEEGVALVKDWINQLPGGCAP